MGRFWPTVHQLNSPGVQKLQDLLRFLITEVLRLLICSSCCASSVIVISASIIASIIVQRSLSFLHTFGDSKAGKIAGCCSRKHVLCAAPPGHHMGRFNILCFSLSLWLAIELGWENDTVCLTWPSKHATAQILRTAFEGKFSVCSKQPMCSNYISRIVCHNGWVFLWYLSFLYCLAQQISYFFLPCGI